DEGALGLEEGMLIGVVGGYRTAQDDHAADRPDVLRQRVPSRHIEVAMVHAVVAQRVGQEPQPLGGSVPKHDPGGALARGVPVLTPPWHGPSFPNGAAGVKASRELAGRVYGLLEPGRLARSRPDAAPWRRPKFTSR